MVQPTPFEVVEHASLLRALRTARTLDLTTHLLSRDGRTQDSRDHRTRWPLLDVPVPEWRLDDEIETLARTIVSQVTCPDDAGHGGSGAGSSTDYVDDSHTTHFLIAHVGSLLARILTALAALRPATAESLQARLSPMTWEDVLAALSLLEAVHPNVVARAGKRLQGIYGASNIKAHERMLVVAAAKAKSAALFSSLALLRPQKMRRGDNGRPIPEAVVQSE